MSAASGSAGITLSRDQRHCSRILQFTKQRPNIAFRYAVASHKESNRGIPKQLVQRWIGAAPIKHNFLPPQFRYREQNVGQFDDDNLTRDDKTEATRGRGQKSAVGFAGRPSGIHLASAA